MAKKKDFYNQSISGEDIELLAQFTGKLDKVLHNKRVSYLRKKNQKETKEVSFEANASYLESVSCRIEVSVEECVEEKLMLEETDKHLQNLPVRGYHMPLHQRDERKGDCQGVGHQAQHGQHA